MQYLFNNTSLLKKLVGQFLEFIDDSFIVVVLQILNMDRLTAYVLKSLALRLLSLRVIPKPEGGGTPW